MSVTQLRWFVDGQCCLLHTSTPAAKYTLSFWKTSSRNIGEEFFAMANMKTSFLRYHWSLSSGPNGVTFASLWVSSQTFTATARVPLPIQRTEPITQQEPLQVTVSLDFRGRQVGDVCVRMHWMPGASGVKNKQKQHEKQWIKFG